MAVANPNGLDYFRRGEPEPNLQAKADPTTLDYFRRGESFDGSFIAPAATASGKRSFVVIIG